MNTEEWLTFSHLLFLSLSLSQSPSVPQNEIRTGPEDLLEQMTCTPFLTFGPTVSKAATVCIICLSSATFLGGRVRQNQVSVGQKGS